MIIDNIFSIGMLLFPDKSTEYIEELKSKVNWMESAIMQIIEKIDNMTNISSMIPNLQ